MANDNCVFCKIVAGDIPCYKLYEDSEVIVMLDAFPVQEGHSLVIPKQHAENLLDLPDKTVAAVLPAAKKVMQVMEKILNPGGYSILQNNRTEAGQEVMHYHLHIVPRYSGRGTKGSRGALHPDKYAYKPTKANLEVLAAKLKVD